MGGKESQSRGERAEPRGLKGEETKKSHGKESQSQGEDENKTRRAEREKTGETKIVRRIG